PVIAGAILFAALMGTALAATSSISSVQVPSHATVGKTYSITVRGTAAKPAALYLFDDYHQCKRTPAGEHRQANGHIWQVNGPFKTTSKWQSPSAHTWHACVFLVKGTAPRNPSHGIIARHFSSFHVG